MNTFYTKTISNNQALFLKFILQNWAVSAYVQAESNLLPKKKFWRVSSFRFITLHWLKIPAATVGSEFKTSILNTYRNLNVQLKRHWLLIFKKRDLAQDTGIFEKASYCLQNWKRHTEQTDVSFSQRVFKNITLP